MKRLAFIAVLLSASFFCTPARAANRERDEQEKASLLTAGKAALEDGLYAIAAKNFDRYIHRASTDEERAQGALLQARVLFGERQFDDVVDLLKRRAGWASKTPSEAGFIYWKARARYEQGAYADALSLLDDLALRFPDSTYSLGAARLRAKCHLQLKNFDLALDEFRNFQKSYSDSPEAPDNLLDWGGTLIELGARGDAVTTLDRLVTSYPASDAATQGSLWLGDLYVGRGEWDKAQEALGALTKREDARSDRRAMAWFALARIHEAQTNVAAAVDALEQGTRIAPDPAMKVQGDAYRAKLLIRSGRVDEGVVLFRQAVRAMPLEKLSAAAQLDLAQVLLDQKLYEKSTAEFQNYLEAFSDKQGQPRALMGKGWSLWGMKRYAESAAAFEKAYSRYTNSDDRAQALLKAGDATFANKQFKLAKERYEKVIAEFPSNLLVPQARLQLAECFAQLNEPDKAEENLKILVEAGEKSPLADAAFIRIAQLKEQQGRWELAMATYDRIISSFSNQAVCAQAFQARGLIRYRLGMFKEALEDFERVTRDYPQSDMTGQSLYMRGWCLYLTGRDQEALALCREFIEKYPDSAWAPDVIFWLGEYYFNHGDYAEAERQFAALAERYPDVQLADDALFWAGRAADQKKDYLRAIEHYNNLAKKYPDSPKLDETRFAQGDALSELGQFAGAILHFEEIIKKYPNSYLVDLAWGRKGDCQFTLGKDEPARYQEAIASYQVVLGSSRAPKDLKWQAEYKIGRCKEKMGQPAEALEHYVNVVYGYLDDAKNGNPGSPLWFTRAAFSAAAIKESEEKWREAVNLYKRVIEANAPAAAEAKQRVEKIRAEHWDLF
jgi:TolA-binding protein